ncbi:MAG: CHAT domain-containing protein [Planctomycetales bacterium]|nr:CHAT domain-containing protein [Planctomycetales bacterium]
MIGPFAARTADGEEPWLAADAALVDIFYYERLDGLYGAPTTRRVPSYVAFVRVGDRLERIELGEAEQIDAKVTAWRNAMSRHEQGTAEAEELARQVWAPLAAALPENLATLYLCADWELGVLPWEALPDAGRQVIDRCHIARLPASRTQRLFQQFQAARSGIAEQPQEGAGGEAVLLVGDVDYGRASPEELLSRAGKPPAYYWRPLPGAKGEVDTVAKAASSRGAVRVLRAGDATKARVLAELPHATQVHFATHGYANADLGVSSQRSTGGVADTFGLALADANRGGPAGLLSATEVGQLKLPRLSLAVLSACETGVAHRRVQFLSNLPRAFHQAGAKHVLASMWKVDDEATRVMMERFYHHYLGPADEADPSRALRAAQLEMRRRPLEVERALASRSPDFAAGPRKLEFDGSASTFQLPDWVWAPWFVSSMSFSEPLSSRAPGLAPSASIRQGGAGVVPVLDASPTPVPSLEFP